MLAVALNYKGAEVEKNLGSILMELFDGFKMIKIYPGDDLKKDQLQLCQSEGYKDLMAYIQENGDPSNSMLELWGPRSKLQKAVRYKFYFDQEKKIENAFLEGCDGFTDFPWAVQVVVVQLPMPDWEQDAEWIRKAELIILNDTDRKESRDFAAKIKMVRPDVPFFIEQVQAGLSEELKYSPEVLFAVYLDKRKNIEKMLQQKQPELLISCKQARRMARELGVSMFLVGSVCDELGYKITRCGLGCF
jgi:hypothetical protein